MPALFRLRNCVLDLPQFRLDILCSANAREDLQGSVGMTVLGEPTRGLGHAQHS